MTRGFIPHICFLSLVLFAPLPAHAKQPKADSDAAISQALQAMEQASLDAEKNHDAAAFEKLVADDWIAISPDGKSQTKAERVAEIKSGHITSATLGDMKVRVFGDAAVVTGTDDEVTMTEGKKSSDHYATYVIRDFVMDDVIYTELHGIISLIDLARPILNFRRWASLAASHTRAHLLGISTSTLTRLRCASDCR